MNIDMEKQELYIGNKKCNIQKLDLTLLNMLYEKAGTCVSREEIKKSFWPTDDNANEKNRCTHQINPESFKRIPRI